jgi:hypothetical protein
MTEAEQTTDDFYIDIRSLSDICVVEVEVMYILAFSGFGTPLKVEVMCISLWVL